MLLKLLERTTSLDRLMLSYVTYQEHFVLRLKTCEERMNILSAG